MICLRVPSNKFCWRRKYSTIIHKNGEKKCGFQTRFCRFCFHFILMDLHVTTYNGTLDKIQLLFVYVEVSLKQLLNSLFKQPLSNSLVHWIELAYLQMLENKRANFLLPEQFSAYKILSVWRNINHDLYRMEAWVYFCFKRISQSHPFFFSFF